MGAEPARCLATAIWEMSVLKVGPIRKASFSLLLGVLIGTSGCGSAAPVGDEAARPDPENPTAEIIIAAEGGGTVIEATAPSDGRLEWLAIAADGWEFDHWEWRGRILWGNGRVTDGTIYLEDNPLVVAVGSYGRVAAVFSEVEPEPPPPPALQPPPPTPSPPPPIHTTSEIQAATWLVVAVSDMSLIFGTAFGVGNNMLATNAHVVEGIIDVASTPGAVVGLFQHETGAARSVTTVWKHPEYDAESLSTPDVGLLRTDASIPVVLNLPSSSTLRELSVFEVVHLCGFPGSVTEQFDIAGLLDGSVRPRATCMEGVISALRPLDPGDAGTPANSVLIQHDMSTEPGMSGSALFLGTGEVIGVHALGLSEESEQNIAIRADLLVELLELTSEGFQGVDLADLAPADAPPAPTGACCIANQCYGEYLQTNCQSVGGAWQGPNTSTCRGCTPPPPSVACAPICYLGSCDSDCDGWLDEVELIYGGNPCDPFDPPFCPTLPATICPVVIGCP